MGASSSRAKNARQPYQRVETQWDQPIPVPYALTLRKHIVEYLLRNKPEEEWPNSYQKRVDARRNKPVPAIGIAVKRWLDENPQMMQWLLDEAQVMLDDPKAKTTHRLLAKVVLDQIQPLRASLAAQIACSSRKTPKAIAHDRRTFVATMVAIGRKKYPRF